MDTDDKIERARAADFREVVRRIGLPSARMRDKYGCANCGSSDALHVYDDHGYCYSCEANFDAIALVDAARDCGFLGAVDWIVSEEVDTVKLDEKTAVDPDRDPSQVYAEHLEHLRPHAESLMDLSRRGGWRGLTPKQVRHFAMVVDTGKILESANRLEEFRRENGSTVGDYGLPHWLPGNRYAVFAYQSTDGAVSTIRYREFPTTSEDDIKTRSLRKDRWAQTAPDLPYLGYGCNDHGADTIYVVEGEVDALSVTATDRWCVASPGAHFKTIWAHRLECDTAIILGDGDDGGAGLVERAHHAFESCHTSTLRLQFPAGCDANDLLQTGNLDEFLTKIETKYL